MRRGGFLLSALGAATFAALLASACCSTGPPIPDGFELAQPNDSGRFVVYGDTRKGMPFEGLLRETEFERERQLVARRLLEEKPDFIVHSGDLVGRGSSGTQWETDWDVATAPLRRAGIPIYMAFGNHEYWYDRGEAARHIARRFPRLAGRHWYSIRAGRILIVVLDSNFDELRKGDAAAQDAWLDRTIAQADADADIATVLLVFHHSPYTNSVTHAPHDESNRRFVDRARRTHKTRGVITGHVHNYERFLVDGIQFVVAGGGGAPKTAVNVDRQRFKDEFAGPAERPFQYCLFTVEAKRIVVDVMMLRGDGTWYRGDGFTIE